MTHAGMLDRAIEESGKALDLDPHSWVAYFNRAEAYAAAGRLAEAVEAAEKAHRLAPWSALAGGALAGVLKRLGNTDRAADVVQQLGGSQRAVIGRVLYHLLCLEPDEAAGWYEKLIEQRDPFALIFAAAPVNQVLRDSPHWPRLARMMNLPEGR
jgi:tetratricopeptide (TPR) repeat protein